MGTAQREMYEQYVAQERAAKRQKFGGDCASARAAFLLERLHRQDSVSPTVAHHIPARKLAGDIVVQLEEGMHGPFRRPHVRIAGGGADRRR